MYSGDAMTDMLWSDPSKTYGKDSTAENYTFNTSRQISYFFTYKAVCEFLRENDLISVIRGHEAQDAGYRQGFSFFINSHQLKQYVQKVIATITLS